MTAPGQAAIARAHSMLGRDFRVINYEFEANCGGENPYADGDWVEADISPQVAPATIDFGHEPERRSGQGNGVQVEQDAVIYLQQGSVDIQPGTGDEERATEFVDIEVGSEYRAVAVEEQLHLTAVHVEEI
ncbi:hypothetical protein [Halorubrum sp. AJ67]|uniref:hypothetical protein n=1 Tax=Halorubrum sp. AJ67 TaxID=1173487 RepID=UPI0018964AE9|nr:hypothetical protein [Halorubrum sp. AJ67]